MLGVDARQNPFYSSLDHAVIRELVPRALGLPAGGWCTTRPFGVYSALTIEAVTLRAADRCLKRFSCENI